MDHHQGRMSEDQHDVDDRAPGDRSRGRQFWEAHYAKGPRPWTGRANPILVRWAESLSPGRALDLGCGEGNNPVWLARHGWRATGVDVSATALARAAAHAAEAGLADRVSFQQHDVERTFPAGQFDLVSALYLESPVAWDRGRALRAAAGAVAPGGLLLIVTHASVAPWSWADPGTAFPTPQEELDALGLDLEGWDVEFLGAPERQMTGPGGQVATVTDNVIALRRRA